MAGEVWTFAEQNGGRLESVAFELLTRGRKLADKRGAVLASIVIGSDTDSDGIKELFERGTDKVYLADDPKLNYYLNEIYTNVFEYLIKTYTPEIIIAGATTMGRSLMPYVAARIVTGLTADCTELDIEEGTGNLLQTRPAIGGNIMATIKTPKHRPQMATVRPKSSGIPARQEGRTGETVKVDIPDNLLNGREERVGFRAMVDEGMNIDEADKIVAGGRGVKKSENFSMINDLARRLGAAVGASRDAVERGWAEYPQQVGLSGKTVVPKLYVALGISGAIQHLAGMKTSETIIAVNNDPEAQILNVADIGVIGDIFEIVPELINELDSRKKG
ncbi:electron transfer flavoprotein subunit alpha/FixB family protein [Candidatus Latescibacterota bacterium]